MNTTTLLSQLRDAAIAADAYWNPQPGQAQHLDLMTEQELSDEVGALLREAERTGLIEPMDPRRDLADHSFAEIALLADEALSRQNRA